MKIALIGYGKMGKTIENIALKRQLSALVLGEPAASAATGDLEAENSLLKQWLALKQK